MNDIPTRERKSGITNKKRSILNYMRSKTSNKVEFKTMISEANDIDLEEEMHNEELNDLPIPPPHSNKSKKYCIDTKTKV